MSIQIICGHKTASVVEMGYGDQVDPAMEQSAAIKNGASGMNKHLNTKNCKSLQSRDSKQSVLQVWPRIESK